MALGLGVLGFGVRGVEADALGLGGSGVGRRVEKAEERVGWRRG